MNKEELEIDSKRLDFNEKVQLVVKKEELKEQDIRLNKLCFDYQEKEKRIAELEKENAELKAIIDNDVDKKIYVQLAKKAELADVQKDQITKAKELLKWALHSDPEHDEDFEKKWEEAEQFLRR